ncbi:glycosyltransferase family 4 protein [Pedobacter panaciterrae]|uniref:glycosyltransferase family 4 protein n=1 Tax=Pedobacter panaciterrae TaxID=363849 RepID=UPI00155D8B68|nr:glycosyltransferase family 4 protein [Pedobacter panaciterrae]NQX55199.1 glycosyltransferase family 4 protein [Pedobacter panaciterrae]
MKILIVTQYFWPENFRINDLALALIERGHDVEVLTGKPNYPQGKFYDSYSFFSKGLEIWNGVKIHRSPLIPRGNSGGLRLMLNYLSFAFFSIIRSFSIGGDFDKILVYEPSPITVGIPAIFMKRRKKANIYFWVQDLWPQSVSAAGGITNKYIIKLLDKITQWIYKASDKVLIQSEAFREIINKQGVEDKKILFYPNSVESIFQVTSPKTEFLSLMPKGFNIMFAGNIGESQDFETIIEAAKIVKSVNPEIKWVILGDGRKKSYVEDKIKEFGLEGNLYLLGSFPVNQMPYFYACADCLLVSLKRDYIFSLTIPSKIQSYLACGKPILASLDGEGGRIITEAKAGLVVESENPTELATRAIDFYNMSKTDIDQMGVNARNYFDVNFERELLVDRLEQIFYNHA